MKKILIILSLIWFGNAVADDTYSATSYNWSTGEYENVDVTFGNTSEIEVYNWNSGEYEYHDIETSSRDFLGNVELETYNWSTGESSTIEID